MKLKGSPQWPIRKSTPIECSNVARVTVSLCACGGTRHVALESASGSIVYLLHESLASADCGHE